ncbi:MAG: hypothetical protein NVSMB5_21560 [Candidatus Velthaea sp.]
MSSSTHKMIAVGVGKDSVEGGRQEDDDITELLSQSIGVKISADATARFYAEPNERGRPS